MSKKQTEVSGNKVLEYELIDFRHPIRKTVTHVPRIIGQKTVGFDELVKRAKSRGLSTIGSETLFKAQFECLMELVQECLGSGDAVNLDGYLRLQPFLKGKVDEKGEVTKSNKLVVRASPLAKLDLSVTSFAWRLKGSRVKRL